MLNMHTVLALCLSFAGYIDHRPSRTSATTTTTTTTYEESKQRYDNDDNGQHED
jgi:hypothetical protein